MSNHLTGDYDAVLLVRVAKINAILGTLHQNGGNEDASPSFPHVARMRIGDPHPVNHPDLADIADWLNAVVREGDGSPAPDFGGLIDTAPPGAASTLQERFQRLQKARVDISFPPLTVRGSVLAQSSTPTIGLAPGSTSEVIVRVHVRAVFKADSGTTALPEPIHGEVHATYVVEAKRVAGRPARTMLQVRLTSDDNKIQFVAAQGSGLSSFDAAQITAQVRKALREEFEPVETRLPDDFHFFQFKELGNGQALALPARLTAPFDLPAALPTVTNNFLNRDFSVAVSREFVDRQLQPAIDEIEQFQLDVPVQLLVTFTTYHVSVSDVTLEWNDGSIVLVVKVRAVASFAPDFDITVRQRLFLTLNVPGQRVRIQAPNDELSISGIPDFLKGRVRSGIIDARNAALPQARDLINDELTKAKTRIVDAVRSIDDSGGVRYEALRVTTHGLILDGSISTKFRQQPIVQFEETTDGTAFTAVESWVPAGRITRFQWSWIDWNDLHATPWGQSVEVSTDDHRFTFAKPAPGITAADICLRVEGTQADRDGHVLPTAAGVTCSVGMPEVLWRIPPSSDPLVTPVWHGEISADTMLEEAVVGHVNMLGASRAGGAAGANSLVHFADPGTAKPLDALGQALARVRRTLPPLVAVVVLPKGFLAGTRREVEAKLGSLGEGSKGRLLLTEDYTGSWGRTFGAKRQPATYLMNGSGAFVWKQEGVLDAEAFAKAIDEHFTTSRVPRIKSIGLTVAPGSRLPRVLLTDHVGEFIQLRKFRGHSVLVTFWQSWSSASIRELQRLQRLQATSDNENVPAVVAVNSGESKEVLTEVQKKYGLGFSLVPDPGGLISRQFGVHCWPTTISLDPDGTVSHVQLGIAHERHAAAY